MNNQKILVGLGALVLVLLGGWYFMSANKASESNAPTTTIQQSSAVTHSVTVAKRKLTPEIVTVTQGDKVTIKVMSDETGEFHISGYEIENDMTAGTELSFSFTADKAGRYNFELHPKADGAEGHNEEATTVDAEAEGAAEKDIVVGAFVVNPR